MESIEATFLQYLQKICSTAPQSYEMLEKEMIPIRTEFGEMMRLLQVDGSVKLKIKLALGI